MKMEVIEYPRDTLEGFAEKHNLKLVLKEFGPDSRYRWSAGFEAVDRLEGGMIISERGWGQTQDQAVESFMKIISDRILVRNPFTKEREEIKVPLLTGVK